jgi:hypothetical protein
MAEESGKAKRRGCFFYGCLGGAVLAVLVLIGGLVGYRYAKKMFNDFTATAPQPLPQVRLSRDEIDKVELRLDEFRQAVRSGKPTPPLELTADEINALIATDPDFSSVKGKLYVVMEGDELKGQLSVPMESVGLTLFKGRFLNGTGTFSLSLHNDRLRLFVMSLKVKGRSVPEVYMEQIRKHNWAEPANDDPRTKVALEHLQEVKVKDGKLVVVPKKSETK